MFHNVSSMNQPLNTNSDKHCNFTEQDDTHLHTNGNYEMFRNIAEAIWTFVQS